MARRTGSSSSPKSRWLRIAASVVAAMTMGASLAVAPAAAFSGSDTVTLPSTSIKLQANAWSQSFTALDRPGKFDWKTSAKATKGGKTFKVSTIKNTATLRAEGLSVSVSNSGVSGSKGVSSQVSLSWTNNKAWISDLSGRSGYTGVLLRFTVNSAAFATHQGVKKSVDVWSW